MFNATDINESIVGWINDLYGEIPVVGIYGEDQSMPVITSRVGTERIITNAGNGNLGFSFVTGVRTTLYVSEYPIILDVFSAIDEEASRIASEIVSAIRESSVKPSAKVSRISDDIKISPPVPKELGGEKAFKVEVVIAMTFKEIKKRSN